MKWSSVIFQIAILVSISISANPPLVFSSTRLIKGIVKKIEDPKPNPFPRTRLELILKKVLTECNSNAYVFIDQPGLTNEDFKVNDQKIFFTLQQKISKHSTVISFPYIEQGLSYERLTKYVSEACEDVDVVRINATDEEELEKGNQLPNYIDTKARIMIVSLPRLPLIGDATYRKSRIEAHDKYIKRVLQQIPSPFVTVVLTSSHTDINDVNFYSGHPKNMELPLNHFSKLSSNYNPMNWITNDKRRLAEQEIFEEVDFEKPKAQEPLPMNNKYEEWLKKEKEEEKEITIFSKEFFEENESAVVLLITVVVMFTLYLMVAAAKHLYGELIRLLRERKRLKEKKVR